MKRLFFMSLFLSLLYFGISVKASESITKQDASEASSKPSQSHHLLSSAVSIAKKAAKPIQKILPQCAQPKQPMDSAALAADSSADYITASSRHSSDSSSNSDVQSVDSDSVPTTPKPTQPKLTRSTSARPAASDAKGAAAIAAWKAGPKKSPTSKRSSLSLSSSTSASAPAHYSHSNAGNSLLASTGSATAAAAASPTALPFHLSDSDNISSSALVVSPHDLAFPFSASSSTDCPSKQANTQADALKLSAQNNNAHASHDNQIVFKGFLKKCGFEPIVLANGTFKRDARGRLLGWLPLHCFPFPHEDYYHVDAEQAKSAAIMIAVSLHTSGCFIYIVDDNGNDLDYRLVYSRNAGCVHEKSDLNKCTDIPILLNQAIPKGKEFTTVNPFEYIRTVIFRSSLDLYDYPEQIPVFAPFDDNAKDIAFYINDCKSGSYSDFNENQKSYWLNKYTFEVANILKEWLNDKLKDACFSELEKAELIKQYMVEVMIYWTIAINHALQYEELLGHGSALCFDLVRERSLYGVLKKIEGLDVKPAHSSMRKFFNQDVQEGHIELSKLTAQYKIECSKFSDEPSRFAKKLSKDLDELKRRLQAEQCT